MPAKPLLPLRCPRRLHQSHVLARIVKLLPRLPPAKKRACDEARITRDAGRDVELAQVERSRLVYIHVYVCMYVCVCVCIFVCVCVLSRWERMLLSTSSRRDD